MTQPLTIKQIRVFQIRIPFSVQVTHNLARRNESLGFLVELVDQHGLRGFGEGTPRTYVTGEVFEDSLKALDKLGSEILGQEFVNEDQLLQVLEELSESEIAQSNPSSFCGFELAILDIFSKKAGVPVWKLLVNEPVEKDVNYSSILPLLSPDQRAKILHLTQQYKIKQIKVKASNVEETLKVMSEITEALGRESDIRIDANEAFTKETAIELIQAMHDKGFAISSMEQPLPKDEIDDMKEVQERTGVPVMADESFCSEKDLDKIIQRQACKGLNVRLSKCGGLIKSKKLVEKALRHGLFCQLGCHVGETSVLSAAGRHLAAVCGPFRFVEGCYSRFLLKEDIVKEPLEFGLFGKAPIPSGPGLGVEISKASLERRCKPLFQIDA